MKRALAISALSLCTSLSLAAESSPKADLAKGESIATKACAACHGEDGNSPAPVNPKLAGQGPEYLYKQLQNFKAAQGKKPQRDNPIMAGMVANLSSDDMLNVAAYFARQKPKTGAARDQATLNAARKLYRAGDIPRGLPACSGCHGPGGAGVPAQYPRLAGQHAEYTETQLKAFRGGQRNNDLNKMMRAIASRMSDAEIRAISDYIAGLR